MAGAAARLDETGRMETWGADPEAMRRRSALAAELDVAARFLGLLRD